MTNDKCQMTDDKGSSRILITGDLSSDICHLSSWIAGESLDGFASDPGLVLPVNWPDQFCWIP
ncbi:MAG: hypothetical protein WBZ19_07230 [Chthoniobacterales bacterium]